MLEREARRAGSAATRVLDRLRVRLLRLRHARGLRRPEDLVRRRGQDLDQLADRLATGWRRGTTRAETRGSADPGVPSEPPGAAGPRGGAACPAR